MEEQEKNHIRLNISGSKFTVVTSDDENYTMKIADRLDSEIKSVRKASSGMSVSSAVMLTALNMCDRLTRLEQEAESLRKQVKEYFEDSAKYRDSYQKAMNENEKLRRDIEIYRKRLGEKNKKAEPAPISPAVKSIHLSDTDEAADEDTQPIAFINGKKMSES